MLFNLFCDTKKQHLMCIEALEKKDLSLIKKIEKQEKIINDDYYRIFRKIVYYFTTFNAYGTELRDLLSFSFIVNEIERIADYAWNIAKFYKTEERFLPEVKILVSSWKKLINYFEEIEEIFKNPDLNKIEQNLEKEEKIDMNKVFENLEKLWEVKSALTFSRKNYYFFLQFKFLSRSYERLTNILEYLLFKKSFFKFRDFQKNR